MAEAKPSIGPPAEFFTSHADRLCHAAGGRRVLDLACGRGRHSLAAAALGLDVLAVDRNAESLEDLAATALAQARIETREVDLEGEARPELQGEVFGAVLVFRYLHRPLMPWISDLLAPGGILLYETFTVAQRSLGWGPTRDDFLLQPGELPRLFPDLTIEDYAEGLSLDAKPAQTARLLASKSG